MDASLGGLRARAGGASPRCGRSAHGAAVRLRDAEAMRLAAQADALRGARRAGGPEPRPGAAGPLRQPADRLHRPGRGAADQRADARRNCCPTAPAASIRCSTARAWPKPPTCGASTPPTRARWPAPRTASACTTSACTWAAATSPKRCARTCGGRRSDFGSACIPLTTQGDSLGWLYLSSPGIGPLPKLKVAVAAADQLAFALANLKLRQSLRDLSVRDPLTGLFNRRYLSESLGRELARCERRELPLSVLAFDLDHRPSTTTTATPPATRSCAASRACWKRTRAARTSPAARAAKSSW